MHTKNCLKERDRTRRLKLQSKQRIINKERLSLSGMEIEKTNENFKTTKCNKMLHNCVYIILYSIKYARRHSIGTKSSQY